MGSVKTHLTMIALIDGDVVLYRSCFATEYNTYSHPAVGTIRHKKDMQGVLLNNFDEDDEEYSQELIVKNLVTEPITHTYNCIDSCIDTIVRNLGVKDYKVYLEGNDDKFRKAIEYPVKYKGNRPPKPSNYSAAKAYLTSRKNTVIVTGPYEVDDALGIEAYRNPNSSVICSVDKDLMMIPGWHYNIEKQLLEKVDADTAMKNFWKQMLMGDRVDNIVGIYGIGIKKAEAIVAKHYPNTIEQKVQDIYREEFKDNWEQMYQANNKLLWILREPHAS